MAKYTEEERETILTDINDRISNGESLRKILLEKDMIDSKTFYKWIDGDDDRKSDVYVKRIQQYTRACARRADAIFEEAISIADTPQEGEITKTDKDGNKEVTKADMIAHRRLQVDTRRWAAGKLNPKKYGDKVQTEHSGEIGVKQITGMDIK